MEENLQRRFEIGDISSDKIIKEPLPIIGPNGDCIQAKAKDAIITQIKNLLMTPIGTYPFDPEYGTLLYKQLFEQIDEITEKQIYYEVRDRVLMYIDDVTVESVNLIWDEQHKTCNVNVVYKIKDDINESDLTVQIKNSAQNMYGAIDDETYGDYRF